MNFLREKIAPYLTTKDCPKRVSLGVAIGVFVGLTPTVGVQMAMVVLIAAIPRLRFNIPIACAMVWISNPFTMIPLYYSMYWFGGVLLTKKDMGFANFKLELQTFIDSIQQGESWLDKFWQGLTGLLDIGLGIAVPMWVGGTAIGILLALPSYFVTLRIYRRVQERHALKVLKKKQKAERS